MALRLRVGRIAPSVDETLPFNALSKTKIAPDSLMFGIGGDN